MDVAATGPPGPARFVTAVENSAARPWAAADLL